MEQHLVRWTPSALARALQASSAVQARRLQSLPRAAPSPCTVPLAQRQPCPFRWGGIPCLRQATRPCGKRPPCASLGSSVLGRYGQHVPVAGLAGSLGPWRVTFAHQASDGVSTTSRFDADAWCCGLPLMTARVAHAVFVMMGWTGFACMEGTGVLSVVDHGCAAPTVFCPAGSAVPEHTPPGHYGVANALGLFVSSTTCEAGR
jgi:hypothetical protein